MGRRTFPGADNLRYRVLVILGPTPACAGLCPPETGGVETTFPSLPCWLSFLFSYARKRTWGQRGQRQRTDILLRLWQRTAAAGEWQTRVAAEFGTWHPGRQLSVISGLIWMHGFGRSRADELRE